MSTNNSSSSSRDAETTSKTWLVHSSQKWTLGVFFVLGAVVIASYALLIVPSVKQGFGVSQSLGTNNASKYWFGIEPSIQVVYYVMMALAAVGFCAVTHWYCTLRSLPKRGLFKHEWVMPVVFGVILAASAGWSFAVTLAPNQKWLVAMFLILVALCSILLVAGVMESEQRRWWAVLGAVAFAATTVLNDGVGWLANYLVK